MGVINKLSDLGGSQDSSQLPYEAEFYGYESSSTENIGIHRKNHNKKTEQTKKANQNTKIKEKTKTKQEQKQKENNTPTRKTRNTTKRNWGKCRFCIVVLTCYFFVLFFSGDSSCRVVLLVILFLFVFFLLKSTFSVLHGFIILWSMVDITN